MRSLIAIALLMCLPSLVSAQAVWRGRSYSHPVCSNPNCRMCNSIRSQLYAPQYSAPSYSPIYTVAPVYNLPTFQPAQRSAASEPTPIELLPVIFELLKPTRYDMFIDVGSGDGRVLREALKHKCLVLGVDLEPTNVQGAVVTKGDALKYDYSGVTMAYLYLYPDLMQQVIDRLPRGTKVVSYSHTTSNMQWERHGHFYLGVKQ